MAEQKAALPGGQVVIDDCKDDGLYHGRHRPVGDVTGEWHPVTEEAPIDNQVWARQNGVWVVAASGGLSVTEIIPAVLTAGTAPTTVHVYGTGFTAATVIQFNGTAVAPAAVWVSADHMTVDVDPTLAVPIVITVTAIDGATVGLGAAGLHIVPASTTTPTVTEIVPDIATVGFSAALQANVYGTGFIDGTSQVLWDGVPLATAFISANQLGITIDTTMGVAPSSVTVTVAGATGAAGFVFVSGGEYNFVIGLTHDDATDDVNLTPAGDSPATLGGVYVVDRVRNMTEGLELGLDGRLRVPEATDALLGGIREPPPDDKGYVRRRDLNGVSAWVPPADAAGYHFGIGLTHDDVTGDVNLTPAGWDQSFLGGVYTTGGRSATEGLDLAAAGTGQISAPLATPELAGTIVEPPPDDKGYVRRTLANGQSSWVPPADTQMPYAGLGLSMDETSTPFTINLQPAGYGDPKFLGGIYEPPMDGMAYSRQYEVATNTWLWTPALTAGLQITGLIPDKAVLGEPIVTVHAYGMEFTPTCVLRVDGTDTATTYISPTELTFFMNPAVPIGPATYIITVHDPAAVPPDLVDGLGAEAFEFIVATTTVDYGTGLAFDTATDPPIVNLQPAQDAPNAIGGVYVIDRERNNTEGLELGIDGRLRVPLATDSLAGSIVEPPPDDKGYVRRRTAAGESAWVPPADPADTHYVLGLTHDDVTGDVNLTPAGIDPQLLGGVWVPPRTHEQAATVETGDGMLVVPLATPYLAGSIIEPPQDDKGYVRRTDINTGIGAWVPPAEGADTHYVIGLTHDDATGDVNLTPAGDAPEFLGGVYVVDRVRNVEEGLELGIDGRLRAPLATDSLAGTILEPPPDDKGYVRRRDLNGVSAWVPPADPADTHYVLGLTHDDVTGDVNLTPAGDAPEFLGGVYVVDRERNVEEGLELGIDGRLRAPLATPRLAGTIVEPEDDGKGYVRTTLNGVSAWVPPADTAIPFFGIGLSHDDTTLPGTVNLQPAGYGDPKFLGGIYEPPMDGLAYSRQYEVATNTWSWVPALTAGLQITGLIPDKAIIGDPVLTVHAYGAEFTPTCVCMLDGADVATVYVSPTELTFQMNPAVPPAPITYIVTVRDTATAEVGIGAESFEFIISSTSVEYGSGLWLDTSLDPPLVNLQPAGDAANRLGGVWVPRRDEQQGLELDTVNMTGELKVPLATPFLAGAMIEPPQDDKGYVRRTDITTGIGAWVPPASQSSVTISDTAPPNPVHEDLWWESDSGKMFIFYDDGTSAQWVEAVQVPAASGGTDAGRGLSMDKTTTPNPTMNLNPAGDSPLTLGGVYVVDRVRTATSGLELDIDGQLRAPLATEIYAGTIVDPPPDGLPYVRKRDIAGVSTWVPPTGGVIISDTPPPNPTQGAGWWESDSGDLFIWYDDGTSAQWVQVNGVSPPPGVYVADAPPMQPFENQLWWDSNAGTLNIWYTDVDTSQWVQVAAPQIPGVPEAPIDGVPYSRRDANWVATTSLAATPGDVKDGFQVNDHGGWIKLDGRLVSSLTSTQQAQANLLGFTTNLPDAASAVGLMNGTAMGTVAGAMTKTIAVANLPAHNMTTGGHDAGAVTTSSYDPGPVTTSNSLNETAGNGPNKGNVASGGTGDDYWLANATHSLNHSHTVDMPAHTHTVDMPNHTHTVALGGSGTPLDVTPKSMSINKFVFLGA